MLPNIDLNSYIYELPQERIAFFPLEQRDKCKLIKADANVTAISHHIFSDLVDMIGDDTVIFANSSKVLYARILASKVSGGRAEIFLTEPLTPSPEYNTALEQRGVVTWKAIIGGKKIRPNDELIAKVNESEFKFVIREKSENQAVVEFNPSDIGLNVRELLNELGKVPLPPYIKRENTPDDKDYYQTVYANLDGSVAAPTAGLHFTEEMIAQLQKKGIAFNELTLHVGMGTFKPLDTPDLNTFDMHSERIIINIENLLALRDAIAGKKNIMAIGTTSTRILESLYYFGCKIIGNRDMSLPEDRDIFEQDYPYTCEISPSAYEAIAAIIDYFNFNGIKELTCRTKLLIVPSFKFHIVNHIITNFHQPNSTLVLLVAAFLGKELWQKAYAIALENDYRFLSYGDACYFIRKDMQ